MVRNFGAYFSWNRISFSSSSPSESRTATPTPDDKHFSFVTNLHLSDKTSPNPKEEAYRQQIISWRAEHNLGGGIISPSQRPRGLDELQECFWIEDNLVRTDLQVTACSNRLDEMHDSAVRIRQELETIQAELAALVNRQRPPIDVENLKTQGSEPVEPPSLQLLPLGPPQTDPPLQAEDNQVESPTRVDILDIPVRSETPALRIEIPASVQTQVPVEIQTQVPVEVQTQVPVEVQTEVLVEVAASVQASTPVQTPPERVETSQAKVPEKAPPSAVQAPASVKPLSGRPKKVLDRFPQQAAARPVVAQERIPVRPSMIKSSKMQEKIQFWSKIQQV